MADNPRRDAAQAMFESWWRGEHADDPDQSEEHVWSMVMGAADDADPLRALLADEDRAVELLARASVDSHVGAGYFDQVSEEWRQTWVAMNRDRLVAQVAALREVAGL